jgi:hypothetical protein
VFYHIGTRKTCLTRVMQDSHESRLFLSLPQAARELGIGIDLLKRAIALRQIRSISLGARVLVPRSAIARLKNDDPPPPKAAA